MVSFFRWLQIAKSAVHLLDPAQQQPRRDNFRRGREWKNYKRSSNFYWVTRSTLETECKENRKTKKSSQQNQVEWRATRLSEFIPISLYINKYTYISFLPNENSFSQIKKNGRQKIWRRGHTYGDMHKQHCNNSLTWDSFALLSLVLSQCGHSEREY